LNGTGYLNLNHQISFAGGESVTVFAVLMASVSTTSTVAPHFLIHINNCSSLHQLKKKDTGCSCHTPSLTTDAGTQYTETAPASTKHAVHQS
jgi:hypothetical protein